MHHEQNTTKIMDTCPNFIHNLLHNPQFHQKIQHPSHPICSPCPHQTHVHH
jgi:hypothetical protein